MDRILSLPTESLTVKDLGEHPADRLSELMRPCFVASPGKRLLIGDYAQVEARGLAWLADDADRIKLFNDESRDLYCESASTLFGRKITKADKQYRQVGKVMELGLGYGMGGPKFNRFALQSKVDLKALGLDATAVVKQWRESVPKITGLWKSYEAGCRDAILNRSTQVSGRARFDYSNGALQIRLPSGRRLWYRNARIENRIPMYVYVLGLEPHTKPTIVYDHPHGREGILYGGLIVENVVQATCRDLLAFHLTECQRTGLDVALHVHDEIVCDTEAGVSVLHEIMSRLPGWAHRFPHKVEVHESERYNK